METERSLSVSFCSPNKITPLSALIPHKGIGVSKEREEDTFEYIRDDIVNYELEDESDDEINNNYQLLANKLGNNFKEITNIEFFKKYISKNKEGNGKYSCLLVYDDLTNYIPRHPLYNKPQKRYVRRNLTLDEIINWKQYKEFFDTEDYKLISFFFYPSSFYKSFAKSLSFLQKLKCSIIDVDFINPKILDQILHNMEKQIIIPANIVSLSGRGAHFYYCFKSKEISYKGNSITVKELISKLTKQYEITENKIQVHSPLQPFRIIGTPTKYYFKFGTVVRAFRIEKELYDINDLCKRAGVLSGINRDFKKCYIEAINKLEDKNKTNVSIKEYKERKNTKLFIFNYYLEEAKKKEEGFRDNCMWVLCALATKYHIKWEHFQPKLKELYNAYKKTQGHPFTAAEVESIKKSVYDTGKYHKISFSKVYEVTGIDLSKFLRSKDKSRRRYYKKYYLQNKIQKLLSKKLPDVEIIKKLHISEKTFYRNKKMLKISNKKC